MKPENIELFDKIAEGVRKAFDKLVHERAASNGVLILSDKDGSIIKVPARDILEKQRLAQKNEQ